MTSETQRIAEIRARERVAQRGPWTYHMDGQSESQLTAGENIYAVDYILSCCNVDDQTLQFIAHAREDVPWLLDALAASRASEARLRAAVLRWDTMRRLGNQQATDAAHRTMLTLAAEWLRLLPKGEEEALLAAAAAPAQGEGDE